MSYYGFGTSSSLDVDPPTGFASDVSLPVTIVVWIRRTQTAWEGQSAEDVVASWIDTSNAYDEGATHKEAAVRVGICNGAAERVSAVLIDNSDASDSNNYDNIDVGSTFGGLWVPVIATFTLTQRKVYLGSSSRKATDTTVYTEAAGSSAGDFRNTLKRFRIGNLAATGFNSFNQTDDRIGPTFIVSKELSDAEVDEIVTGAETSETGPEPTTLSFAASILAYWPLTTDQATHTDQSGNGGPDLDEVGTLTWSSASPTFTSGIIVPSYYHLRNNTGSGL
jgi:hypothetical protein